MIQRTIGAAEQIHVETAIHLAAAPNARSIESEINQALAETAAAPVRIGVIHRKGAQRCLHSPIAFAVEIGVEQNHARKLHRQFLSSLHFRLRQIRQALFLDGCHLIGGNRRRIGSGDSHLRRGAVAGG